MKKALITGVTGQDGSYLSEFLLEKGYEVHGIIRRSSVDFRERIVHLEGREHFHLHYGDLTDSISLVKIVSAVHPDEIYNLAAQSHVQVSFDVPEYTADVDATGVLRILEAVRVCGLGDTCRIYQASTSELYGKVEEVPQNVGWWCFSDFDERPEDLLWENCEWAYLPTRARLGYLETHTNLEEKTRQKRRYDVWAQAVAPLACIVITLFAIPMGIATGRQSVFRGAHPSEREAGRLCNCNR